MAWRCDVARDKTQEVTVGRARGVGAGNGILLTITLFVTNLHCVVDDDVIKCIVGRAASQAASAYSVHRDSDDFSAPVWPPVLAMPTALSFFSPTKVSELGLVPPRFALSLGQSIFHPMRKTFRVPWLNKMVGRSGISFWIPILQMECSSSARI